MRRSFFLTGDDIPCEGAFGFKLEAGFFTVIGLNIFSKCCWHSCSMILVQNLSFIIELEIQWISLHRSVICKRYKLCLPIHQLVPFGHLWVTVFLVGDLILSKADILESTFDIQCPAIEAWIFQPSSTLTFDSWWRSRPIVTVEIWVVHSKLQFFRRWWGSHNAHASFYRRNLEATVDL